MGMKKEMKLPGRPGKETDRRRKPGGVMRKDQKGKKNREGQVLSAGRNSRCRLG